MRTLLTFFLASGPPQGLHFQFPAPDQGLCAREVRGDEPVSIGHTNNPSPGGEDWQRGGQGWPQGPHPCGVLWCHTEARVLSPHSLVYSYYK